MEEGLEHCELCITSEDPALLNVPWELIQDPTPGRGYLAPLLAGLYRHRTGHKLENQLEPSPDEPFRILLVIARPYGKRDIAFGTIARPLLEALRPLHPRVQLEILRPPTFNALQQRLNDRRGHYHLVHFDGHGVFARSSGRPFTHYGAAANHGHLVFEKDDASEHIVNSEDLGQILAASKVPLFVLNACQSAEEGEEAAFSSVASRLVAAGAKGVVAMSYAVYASAAARFIQSFYQSLVRNTSLAEAVAAGRRELYTQPFRDSVIGPIEFRDWMVPALYQQESGYVPIPESGAPPAAEQTAEDQDLGQRAEQTCPEGAFGFIGRDYDILQIERALCDDNSPWVLLTGIGGTGKTALAFGFARWYAETGGCPGGLFAASFKEKAGFGQVVGSIVGHGTDFSRLPEEKQWQFLISHLRENPCLLVWDNFEPVAGYPEGAPPLATDEERDKLSCFLKALKGGKSRVLITTRKPGEKWLGIAYQLIEVSGLVERDAAQLAKVILRTVGREPHQFKDDPDYSRLIGLLKGHPRSLEVVLPQLRRKRPAEIIQALQHRTDDLGEAVEDASLSYAFSLMSERTRRHLPFAGLFSSYIHAGTLGLFTEADKTQEGIYQALMGDSIDSAGWETVLEEASRAGLVRPLGSRIYELHPTLPTFFRKQLLSTVREEGLQRLDTQFMGFYAAWAGHFFEDIRKADENAVIAITLEEANLLRALRVAEMKEEWAAAQALSQTLGEFYEVRGRTDEWRALRGHLLSQVGREIAADANRNRADLWMYLLGNEANDALSRNELENAEAAYLLILNFLVSLNNPAAEPRIAAACHQLGRVAQERQRFDEAEEWYRKALEIYERLGLEREAASDYHQLGIIAQKRQRFDEAEEWYRKALEIKERLGHPPLSVNTLAQFGLLRREQRRPAEAVGWFGKALAISAKYEMHVGRQIMVDLARLMKAMGEEEFAAAWKEVFGEQEPPFDTLREIAKQLE